MLLVLLLLLLLLLRLCQSTPPTLSLSLSPYPRLRLNTRWINTSDVQLSRDRCGNRDNLRPKLSLDFEKIKAIFIGDEIDGEPEMAKSTGSADSVEVGLGILGEIKVDDDVHRLNVNASREEIG